MISVLNTHAATMPRIKPCKRDERLNGSPKIGLSSMPTCWPTTSAEWIAILTTLLRTRFGAKFGSYCVVTANRHLRNVFLVAKLAHSNFTLKAFGNPGCPGKITAMVQASGVSTTKFLSSLLIWTILWISRLAFISRIKDRFRAKRIEKNGINLILPSLRLYVPA